MKYTAYALLLLVVLTGASCDLADKTGCAETLKEIRNMGDITIMDYGDYEVWLPPLTYCAGDYMRHIFAVPMDNAVGTNELDNAVTLLKFKDDKELEKEIVKKDFMEMVSGPFEYRFLPVWSNAEIAYSQTKGFLIVNISDKKVEIHSICSGLYDGQIENIAVLDGAKRTFVIEVNTNAAGIGNYNKILKIVRFSNDTFTVLSERPAGIKTSSYSEPWFVHDKKIFIYTDSTTKIEVFDEQFKPVSHPLAETFNQSSKLFRSLREICLHPELPFALIVEMGKIPTKEKLMAIDLLSDEESECARELLYDEVSRTTLYLFRWQEQDVKQRFVPLLSAAGSVWNKYNPANNYGEFTFSPDGKWVVFRDYSQTGDNPIFVALPIDQKNPLYLGKPIKLGNAMRGGAIKPTGTAWTTSPTAIIMCDGIALYRWVLADYKKYSMKKVKMPPTAPDPFNKKDE
jgi:hypothetical protein